MITKSELISWLNELPEDAEISVDDGGLTLVCGVGGADEPYIEVGGIPLEDEEE